MTTKMPMIEDYVAVRRALCQRGSRNGRAAPDYKTLHPYHPLLNHPPPRLTEQLDDGLQGKLTVVSAPDGFGKSTLLNKALHPTNMSRNLRGNS